MQTYYFGRKVHNKNGYPAVLWPEHPLAYANGAVYVHRAEWYRHHGVIPQGFHVHHVDHDAQNWNIDNLVLLSASEHAWHHLKKPGQERATIVTCQHCSKEIKRAKCNLYAARIFCSRDCRCAADRLLKKTKISWPSPEDVRDQVVKTNYSAVARTLGVSNTAVKKYLKRWNLCP